MNRIIFSSGFRTRIDLFKMKHLQKEWKKLIIRRQKLLQKTLKI